MRPLSPTIAPARPKIPTMQAQQSSSVQNDVLSDVQSRAQNNVQSRDNLAKFPKADADAVYCPAPRLAAQSQQNQTQNQMALATATHGGRGVGGTLALLRPTMNQTTTGIAAFVPMQALIDLAKTGAPAPTGLAILDTNLGDLEKTAHPSWQAATVDHHGPIHGTTNGAAKGRGVNSTTQLLDRFEDALQKNTALFAKSAQPDANTNNTINTIKKNPQFTAARVLVEKTAKAHNIAATDQQKDVAAASILSLQLTQISSDNVGDGLSWPVWMAKNQARVFLDADIRNTIREATIHEDFAVFGGNYLQGKDSIDELSAPIKLQSALFLSYDEALKQAGIIGTDRVPSEKAEAIAMQVSAAIDALLADPALVDKRCNDFFFQIGQALAATEENALVREASIPSFDARGWKLPVFDVSKMPNELGTFARWAVPPLFSDHSLQMTTIKNAESGRATTILAIPDERSLPSGKGLLSILDALNQLEQQKTPAGEKPATWFGRDVVVLPSPPGSLLTPMDVCNVVMQAKLLVAE